MTRPQNDILAIHAALADGTTTATEIGRAARAKAKASGTTFITIADDDDSSDASDARREAGTVRSVLDGVPIAVKDVIETANLRTTMGSALFADHVPAHDAPLVKQLKAAGANVIGKTNTQEFSYGIRGDTGAFGVVANPHDPSRVAGGSSSGSAAAVSAGIAPLAVGTDTAGSIRVPAALCGVTGFKPSYGLLDTTGIFPLSPSFDTPGFLAQSVNDITVTMDALGLPALNSQAIDTGKVTYKTLTDNPIFHGPGHEDSTYVAIVEALEATDVTHPLINGQTADYIGLYNIVRSREAFLIHEQDVATAPEKYQPTVLARVQEGAFITDDQVNQALATIDEIATAYGESFADTDILLSSTVPIEAPLLDDSPSAGSLALMSQCVIWNLLGWPALAIPYWPINSSLPESVQVIGKPGHDADVLQAGRHIEQLLAARQIARGEHSAHIAR